MSTPQPSSRYRLDPRARFRVLDGEGIFVLQEAGEVVVLNSVGAFIVERLRDSMPFEDVVRSVVRRYDVEADLARRDAGALIGELLEAGALTES